MSFLNRNRLYINYWWHKLLLVFLNISLFVVDSFIYYLDKISSVSVLARFLHILAFILTSLSFWFLLFLAWHSST